MNFLERIKEYFYKNSQDYLIAKYEEIINMQGQVSGQEQHTTPIVIPQPVTTTVLSPIIFKK